VLVVRSRRIGHLGHCMHTHRPGITHLGSILVKQENRENVRELKKVITFGKNVWRGDDSPGRRAGGNTGRSPFQGLLSLQARLALA